MCRDSNCLLFSLLRTLFSNSELPEEYKLLATKESLDKVMALASKHDIANILALSIINNGLSSEASESTFQKYAFQAVYRYEMQNHEFLKICETLEKAEIPFIPLKGSVLRNYYQEPWWRTSCDIDILVEQHNLHRAIISLTETLKYAVKKQNSHDVALASENGICLELHFYLGEEGRANLAVETLKNVWGYVNPKCGYNYWLEMRDDMFYYYHIAHMAEHFETGGCGIRPFIDLWILDNLKSADAKRRDVLLKEGNLLNFANSVRKLSKVWFGSDCHDITTKEMEDYILRGGVYGSIENNVKVQQARKGNRVSVIMSKIFLPASHLERIYPSIKNKRWLIPFMQIRRWITVAIRGISPRTKAELKHNHEISITQSDHMQAFLESIGL